MRRVNVTLKSGEKLCGTLWQVKPLEGWFSVTLDDPPEIDAVKVQVEDCQSAILEKAIVGIRDGKPLVKEEDLLVKIRKDKDMIQSITGEV